MHARHRVTTPRHPIHQPHFLKVVYGVRALHSDGCQTKPAFRRFVPCFTEVLAPRRADPSALSKRPWRLSQRRIHSLSLVVSLRVAARVDGYAQTVFFWRFWPFFLISWPRGERIPWLLGKSRGDSMRALSVVVVYGGHKGEITPFLDPSALSKGPWQLSQRRIHALSLVIIHSDPTSLPTQCRMHALLLVVVYGGCKGCVAPRTLVKLIEGVF
ncbi:uncharacterized protein LACBIDRAFT_328010 [Laccaria bicolor S238N-H82]|uniref:Predicted protein n=1 Tax=Laccaria bicolor (strain S238N-H82 / ATCC MYA-4686) TaxID=486041 RepID=B0DDJ4_LACBS|nr:uncharacterized protein LACBIDRAFT_328010 [Laccaria bicolor S238N-H82]EDR07622.1 predicted protein [Laccaria bicolor S238N-H82]|eukprot:XP_001882014.1 predicted protein [Laccaria bicolor S238N-H82]